MSYIHRSHWMLSFARAVIIRSLARVLVPIACLGVVCEAVASQGAPGGSIDTTATDTSSLRGILREAFRITVSEPERALHLSEVVVRKARALRDGRLEGAALHQRASALEILGRYDEAALDGQRSVELFHVAQDRLGEARSLQALAGVRRWQGRYAEAIALLKTGISLCQASGSKSDEADHELGIGLIYYDEKLYPEALAYTLRAAAIFEALKDTAATSAAYANIGLSHYELAQYNKALEFHERSLALSRSQGDLEGMASSLNNIAIVQRKQGRTKEAMATQLQALAICDSLGSTWGSALCHKNLGLLHLDMGNARSAVQECERALKDFERIGALAMEGMACQCLYDAYKRVNDPARALGLLERIVLIKDSLKLDDARSQLDHMEFEKQLLADSLAHETEKHRLEIAAQAQVTHERERKNMFLFIGVLVVLLAGGLWMRLRYVHRSRAAIRKERDRSEELLLNILPAEVAEELKDTGAAAAKHFDNATILFTDFKGFTQASERMSPQELVEELNTCFRAFDRIITARGIEKIKTIGDAYMCAGGLPDPASSTPSDVVHAALEMQAFMKSYKVLRIAEGKPAFTMRVGIHTGPVVAGIVGVKKFAYDIWGDTVNIASRMESSGEVGQVNISEATYALVKNEPGLTFTPRGKVQAKGKGEMEMYFVDEV